jgi:NADH-quinone oxidoreductase subunit N
MNVGIFAVVSHVGGYDDHLWSITDYRGLGYRSPVLAGAMAFFLLSLIGIPFTGGFFAKFYVFSAALQQRMFGLAIIGLINSGIAAFYYLRLLTALYSKPADGSPVLAVPRMSLTLGFAILLAASATLLLGIVPRSSLDLAQRGASTFFTGAAPAQPVASASPALKSDQP